jgi:hypothetical protein
VRVEISSCSFITSLFTMLTACRSAVRPFSTCWYFFHSYGTKKRRKRIASGITRTRRGRSGEGRMRRVGTVTFAQHGLGPPAAEAEVEAAAAAARAEVSCEDSLSAASAAIPA